MTKVCGAIGGLVGCEQSLGRGCTARYLSANSITILLTSPPLCTLPASLLTATALTFYIYLSPKRDVDDGEQANQQWQLFDINNKHRQQKQKQQQQHFIIFYFIHPSCQKWSLLLANI